MWWTGNVLPPSVFVGHKVNFIGRISTFNEGKIIRVSDAVPFQGSYRRIIEPLRKYLWQFLDDPREWIPDDYKPFAQIIDVD